MFFVSFIPLNLGANSKALNECIKELDQFSDYGNLDLVSAPKYRAHGWTDGKKQRIYFEPVDQKQMPLYIDVPKDLKGKAFNTIFSKILYPKLILEGDVVTVKQMVYAFKNDGDPFLKNQIQVSSREDQHYKESLVNTIIRKSKEVESKVNDGKLEPEMKYMYATNICHRAIRKSGVDQAQYQVAINVSTEIKCHQKLEQYMVKMGLPSDDFQKKCRGIEHSNIKKAANRSTTVAE